MIKLTGTAVRTPLASGIEANIRGIEAGQTMLRRYSAPPMEDYVASMWDERPEWVTLATECAREAIADAGIEVDGEELLVISTTKGKDLQLLAPAQHVARALGLRTKPIVVSNACTSGVCAQVEAARLLMTGHYKRAIIIGIELQSRFILSGFQSFKALSPERCKPFDKNRQGLNAGEAVAAMIMERDGSGPGWYYHKGAVHNDANHISGPSRVGEGSYLCLKDVLEGVDKEQIMMVSLHGTGTLYNDEMESIAMHRAGLDEVPCGGLKGVYGHTMGAAGVLETILNMKAIEEGKLLPTVGYEEQGTTYRLNLSNKVRKAEEGKKVLVKLLSGFGGVNAAVSLELKVGETI